MYCFSIQSNVFFNSFKYSICDPGGVVPINHWVWFDFDKREPVMSRTYPSDHIIAQALSQKEIPEASRRIISLSNAGLGIMKKLYSLPLSLYEMRFQLSVCTLAKQKFFSSCFIRIREISSILFLNLMSKLILSHNTAIDIGKNDATKYLCCCQYLCHAYLCERIAH